MSKLFQIAVAPLLLPLCEQCSWAKHVYWARVSPFD